MGNRMPRQERAKQFMPFAALKGYEAALQEKEKLVVAKIELAEDYKEELDYKFQQVREGVMISVVYFCKGEYLKVTGMVSRVDEAAGVLKVVNTEIRFEDIYEICF